MNRSRLALLTSTHAVNDLYQGLVPALLPFMVLERGYSYTAVSGLMLAASGLSSVIQPLFGLYADREPRPWMVPLGFCVAALGLMLMGMSGSYWMSWLAAALCGLGIAAFHPPATVAARMAGGTSQKAMSVFSVGGTMGASFAPVLAALVVGGGMLGRSWLLTAPALVMLLVWWGCTRHDARAASAAGNTAARRVAPQARNDWRAFWLLCAVIVGWSIPYVTVISMIALYVTRELGGTSFQGAATLTTFTAAGAAGTLLGGWVGDRWGRMRSIRAGYLLAIPALAGLALAGTPALAWLCTLALGVTLFLPFAAQVTLAQDYLPRNQATASGLTLGLAMSIGGMVAPLFGMLSDARGLRFTLCTVLVLFCVATVLAWCLRNREREMALAEAGAAPARS